MRHLSFLTIWAGPDFINFDIPKLAVASEVKSVAMKSQSAIPSDVIGEGGNLHSSNPSLLLTKIMKRITSKTCTCGTDSTNGSERMGHLVNQF